MSDISKITLPNNVEYDLKDAKARKISNIVSLLNLIDNGYFGLGVINQRAQAKYNNLESGVYCIDRWHAGAGTPTVTIEADGIKLENGVIRQTLNVSRSILAGKTLTYSALCIVDGTSVCYSASATVPATGNTLFANLIGSVPGGSYCNLYAQNDIILARFGQSSGNSIKIVALKAELGDTQTLAHQENGVWVLNELPNLTRELLKCQRYYLPLSQFSAGVPIYRDTDSIYWPVSIPITMENTTNLNLIGTPKVYNVSNNNEITDFTFEIQSSGSNVVIIKGTKTTHGATTPRLELIDCAFSTEI